jgi:hypothetical protein
MNTALLRVQSLVLKLLNKFERRVGMLINYATEVQNPEPSMFR